MNQTIPYDFGLLAETIITNPAAGAPVIYRAVARTRHLVFSIAFTLTTDANVANRTVYISLDFSGIQHQIAFTGSLQPASTVWAYNFHTSPLITSAAIPWGAAAQLIVYPLSTNLFLNDRKDLNITALNLQAGDQFSNISVSSHYWAAR
jgi:hypothetical protein